jgi:nucleoside-triphosphatase
MGQESKRAVRHILITGMPGTGKTTLIISFVARLPGTKTGFFTREIREDGVRKGFLIETLDGRTAPLADSTMTLGPRIGKYRVSVRSIDEVAVPALFSPADVIIVDEIGKMECVSGVFVKAVEKILDGDALVVATIAKRGSALIEEIKSRSNTILYEVTPTNRSTLIDRILAENSSLDNSAESLS